MIFDESSVSRETLVRLQSHIDMLKRWNPAINLISKSTEKDVWMRHVIDSAQLFPHASLGDAWIDLGAGGGFPGMVIAILGKEWRPNLRVTLIESDQRKAVFLREVARKTETSVTVLAERSEALAPLAANTLSARAFAPLINLMPHVERHLAKSGTALLQKGANHREEVAEARKSWEFTWQAVPSQTDSQAVILKIQGVSRV